MDLLIKPGQIMAPDSRLAAPPAVIASPLQFERPSPFGGSSVSVVHWARGEVGPKGGSGPRHGGNPDSALTATSTTAVSALPIKTGTLDADKNSLSSPRAQNMGPWRGGIPSPRGNIAPQPFDFTPLQFDQRTSVAQIAKEREMEKENSSPMENYQGSQPNYNQDLARNRNLDVVTSGQSDHESAGRLIEGRGGTPSSQDEDSTRLTTEQLVENAVEFAREFEILWEDLIIGERIGQGLSFMLLLIKFRLIICSLFISFSVTKL